MIFIVFFMIGLNILNYLHSNWLSLFIFRTPLVINNGFAQLKKQVKSLLIYL